ncbi:hypothetical protein K1719_000709 [Acacia pycnantha]|nr:hypothetical protein K1719_000709 [Acacia pycnantha]
MQTLLLPAAPAGCFTVVPSGSAEAASDLRNSPSLQKLIPKVLLLPLRPMRNQKKQNLLRFQRGKITSPATFYATSGGLVAAFISVFWSFGYIRLSNKLRRTANEPTKAPARADVVKSLKNGIVLNLLGMGAAILGMQATVGALVGKALTSSANPYYSGMSPGSSPVLALDVFLVQASANTILSHFLGLVFSLELLRSVTLPTSEAIPIPKLA